MRILALTLAVVGLAPAASAQMRPMPAVFAGGSFAAAPNDGDSRMRAVTRGRSFQSFGEQRERAVLGIVRIRAAAHRRIALDVAGGAGVLLQHHEASFAPCFSGCEVSSVRTLDHTATAIAAGVDVPIHIARHFEMAATGRYYFLQCGDNLPDDPRDLLPWQFEYRSSARIVIGGGARVVW